MSALDRSIKNLEKAMKSTRVKTGRSMRQSVEKACIALCKSGRRQFKSNSSKTRREYSRFKMDTTRARADKGSPWIVRVRRQMSSDVFIHIPSKGLGNRGPSRTKPPIKPENIGLAYRSWGWLLKKMPNPVSVGGNMRKQSRHGLNARTQAHVNIAKWKGYNPEIKLTNDLTYLEEHLPGLSAMVIQKAANRMQKQAKMGYEQVARTWA